MSQPLHVVCAVIENNAKQILACQRSGNSANPGKWEFPGGKIEANESHAAALKREIYEELEIDINIISPLPTIHHSYPDFDIALHPYLCHIIGNSEPTPLEHADLRWLTPSESKSLDWAEADRPILRHLIEG